MERFNCLFCTEVAEAQSLFNLSYDLVMIDKNDENGGLSITLTEWWEKTNEMCTAAVPVGLSNQDVCDVEPEVQAMEAIGFDWPECMERFDWRKLKEAHG